VDGRVGGTDGLARGDLALLAHDRHRDHFQVLLLVIGAGEPAVDADPGHVAALEHLALADDGDVVLGAAGDEAGVAADARIEIDRHAPLEALIVGRGRVDRLGGGEFAVHLGGEAGLLLELLERSLAGDVAPLHVLMLLGAGEDVVVPGQALDLHAGAEAEGGGSRGAGRRRSRPSP